jgi:hypothetical protein
LSLIIRLGFPDPGPLGKEGWERLEGIGFSFSIEERLDRLPQNNYGNQQILIYLISQETERQRPPETVRGFMKSHRLH